MNLTYIQRIALKLLVRAMQTDRDKPVYIILTGDDRAEVQEQGGAVTKYQFYSNQYKHLKPDTDGKP